MCIAQGPPVFIKRVLTSANYLHISNGMSCSKTGFVWFSASISVLTFCLDWRGMSSRKTRAQLILWISPVYCKGFGNKIPYISSYNYLHNNPVCLWEGIFMIQRNGISVLFVKLSRGNFSSILAFYFDLGLVCGACLHVLLKCVLKIWIRPVDIVI